MVLGFSWWASLPLTSALTADVYGLRHLGTLNGVVFLGHQMGGALSIQLGGLLHDLTGSYALPFAVGRGCSSSSQAWAALRLMNGNTRWGTKPNHTRVAHSGGDSWLSLSDQTVDLDRPFGVIVKPRYFRGPGSIGLHMMLDILDQIA